MAGTTTTLLDKGIAPSGRLHGPWQDELGPGLDVMVTPVPQEGSILEADGMRPCAAVFLSRPGRAQVPWAPIAACLGLTPAEARLASHLAGGTSLEEASESLGVSIHTARTQLKAVFAKTGTRRQGELVALLMQGVLANLRHQETP